MYDFVDRPPAMLAPGGTLCTCPVDAATRRRDGSALPSRDAAS